MWCGKAYSKISEESPTGLWPKLYTTLSNYGPRCIDIPGAPRRRQIAKTYVALHADRRHRPLASDEQEAPSTDTG
jgi:hypothetical protein